MCVYAISICQSHFASTVVSALAFAQLDLYHNIGGTLRHVIGVIHVMIKAA